jgi:hypothetical protein
MKTIFNLMDKEVKKLDHLLKKKIINNVDKSSIEIEDIDMKDYPDFVDAFISSARFNDGTELNDEQLEQLQDENYEIVNELIHENQLYL